MNKNYVYKDGLALIIDEDGNQRTVEYYDNLDKVLVEEDLIEAIEKKISRLEKATAGFEKSSKKISSWFPFITGTLVPIISIPLLEIVFKGGPTETLLGLSQMTWLCIGMTPLFSLMGAIMSLEWRRQDKERINIQKGKEIELEYLRKELVEHKQYVEELKRDKTNSKKIDEFYIAPVDNVQSLRKLDTFLEFCHDLGYNEDKYFRYYQKGKLDDKIREFSNENGVQMANRHFEEKASVLKKTRKINKK